MRRLSLAACVGLTVCAPMPADEPPKKVALLVGVKEYRKNLDPLRFTENDAVELGVVLKKYGYEVVVLCDSLGAKDAALLPTKKNILAKLEVFRKKLERPDTFFVGFAGHGLQFGDDDHPYFCPVEADKTDKDTLIDLNAVAKTVENSGAGVRLMVVDACRNDPAVKLGAIDLHTARPPKGGAALFSCSQGQFAREAPELKHGVFFYHFIQAIQNPKLADEETGEVTWSRVQEYTAKQTNKYVREKIGLGARQEPHQLMDISGDSPVLLTLKASGGSSAVVAAGDDKEEAFEWKDEKRTRKVLTLDLGGEKMKFVRIKAGKFQMGSPDSDKDAGKNEKPQHEVTLTKDFYMAEHTVTVEQFAAFVKATGYETTLEKAKADNTWRMPVFVRKEKGHPVVFVSYDDALKYCEWATGQAKRTVCLPTESQWEYACRGGTATKFFTGDDPESLEGYANVNQYDDVRKRDEYKFKSKNMYRYSSPVGSFKPNPFGLYDMTGNVTQWCRDWESDAYYAKEEAKKDPQGPTGPASSRILRGASWHHDPKDCRSANRGSTLPGYGLVSTGFRVSLRLD